MQAHKLTSNVHPVGMGNKSNRRVDDFEESNPLCFLKTMVDLLSASEKIIPCTLNPFRSAIMSFQAYYLKAITTHSS